MGKIIDKATALIAGWSGLKKAVEKGDEAAIRRILIDHEVRCEMVDILLLIPAEAARLQAIIDDNQNLGNATDLTNEMSALHRAQPATPEDAKKIVAAISDCQKRIDKNWFGQFALRDAENELGSLRACFSEIFDGTLSEKAYHLNLTANIYNSFIEAGLNPGLLSKGSWRDVYKRAPLEQKKRRRLFAAGGQ